MVENGEIIEGNGYQILVEGSADLLVQSENVQYNFSALVRDLYNKIYHLTQKVKELEAVAKPIQKNAIPSKDISTQTAAGP